MTVSAVIYLTDGAFGHADATRLIPEGTGTMGCWYHLFGSSRYVNRSELSARCDAFAPLSWEGQPLTAMVPVLLGWQTVPVYRFIPGMRLPELGKLM